MKDLEEADDRAAFLARMSEAEVIQALGAASAAGDAYLSNVLTTELLNRVGYTFLRGMSAALGLAGFFCALAAILAALIPRALGNWPAWAVFGIVSIGLLFGATILSFASTMVRRSRVGFFRRALRLIR